MDRTAMFIVTPEVVAFLRAAELATYAGQFDEASVAPLLPGFEPDGPWH